MAAVGSGFTVTVCDATAVQPLASVTVTLYAVVLAGDTVMLAVVAPVFHSYPEPPLAVRVVFSPSQMMVSPVMAAFGSGFTVTIRLAASVQPLPSVTVTPYVVVLAGDTVMADVVAPLLHR